MRKSYNDFYRYRIYNHLKTFMKCTPIVKLIFKLKFYDDECNL